MSIRDLMKIAEKVFDSRETPKEKAERIRKKDHKFQSRKNRKQQREMTRIFWLGSEMGQGLLGPRRGDGAPAGTGPG